MSTFKQICQDVARESGTVQGTFPTSVTGQSGRLLKIVNWVITAWEMIQTEHTGWRFMKKPFSGALTSGTQKYTAASWGVTDFAEWIIDNDVDGRVFSLYLTATGQSDEGPLVLVPNYNHFRQKWEWGSHDNSRPTEYAIDHSNQVCFGATPDDAYTVRGLYRRTPQILSANDDEPTCPARFHKAIQWRALVLLAEHDEALTNLATYRANYNDMMDDLRRDQLPRITVGSSSLDNY